MADIKIDEELLLRAGLGIGYAFAPFFRGIMNGVEDYTIEQAAREMQEEHDAQEAEEGLKRPVEETLIGDCRKCWCDQCAKLEQCVHLREGALPDGVRPFPCVGCADGMRFKPCEEERCADFEQAQDLITADKTKKENVRLRRSGRSLFLLHSCKRSYSILKIIAFYGAFVKEGRRDYAEG